MSVEVIFMCENDHFKGLFARAMQFARLQLNYLNLIIKAWFSKHYTHLFICFALFALIFID